MEQNIIQKLLAVTTSTQAEEVINEACPNWLVYYFNAYSYDYPILTNNWKLVCEKMNTTPKHIILVEDIDFQDPPTLKDKLCDFMTSVGYCVRRSGEFVPCTVCQKAIPCKEIWLNLKSRGIQVPEEWSDKCLSC